MQDRRRVKRRMVLISCWNLLTSHEATFSLVAKLARQALLCSERYQESQEKRRSDTSDTNNAEREIIAVLNRIRGDTDAASKRDAGALALNWYICCSLLQRRRLTRLSGGYQHEHLAGVFAAIRVLCATGYREDADGSTRAPRMLMESHACSTSHPQSSKVSTRSGIKRSSKLCVSRRALSDANDDGKRFGKRRLALPSRAQLRS